MHQRVVAILAALLLAGCGMQDLYTQLSEQQANEMVAVLRNAGLSAEKELREGNSFAVSTRSGDFARAVTVLRAGGYPRDSFESMGRVFKKEGFVSSPLEERARLVHALSQEIANSISQIDGVMVARVHLAVPEKDPLADKPHPAAASVFIKHRAGKDLSGSVGQIKALVVNGVEGLPYDNVTVVLFPAEPWPEAGGAAPAVAARPLSAMDDTLVALAGGGGALALGGGFWAWRRRQDEEKPRRSGAATSPRSAKGSA